MAMGYGQRYFVGVVVREAFYLALAGLRARPLHHLGAVPVDHAVDRSDHDAVAAEHRPSRWLCTVIMCVVSGLLAVRKLLAADPASLF